jgi:tripartite ATP-independent transporter DctP family solute receptor
LVDRRWQLLFAGVLFSLLMTFAAACGGFGGEPAAEGDGNGEAAGEDGPELSEPPEIEGEVVAEGDEHTIRVGIGLAEDSPQGRSVQYFRDILDERTEGRLEVQLFPDSQVGDDNEMMNALQTGTLEMTFPSTSPAATIVPELAVYDLPFLFPTPESADEVLDSELGQQLLDEFEGTGIKALVYAENGYRQLTNSRGAVESPEDVDGLRVRVMENEVHVDLWRTLGANPTSMAFGEVFSAMEQGVIDGQENPWSTILTSNFYEVQDYGSETRHVYTPFIFMISQGFWDDLSPEDQEIIQEAAEQTRDYQRTISREYDQWSKERLADQGMEITELDESQVAEFQEAVEPVYDTWAPRIGEDIVQEIQDMVAEVEGQ